MSSEKELDPDILQPIPLEEWPQLQTLLKVEWPKYSFYYYWVRNSYLWKKQDPDLELDVYSPQGNYQDDVTFVGISNFSVWSVIVFTKESSGERLQEAIIKTNRINWSKNIAFTAVHEYILPIFLPALETLLTTRGIEIDEYASGCFRIKSAEECANTEVKIPEGCYVADLNSSHIPLINSLWPEADTVEPENSLKFLRTMATFNQCMGLFLKEGNILVSWSFHNDWHGLGTVQTLEAYKRRGYAKVVVNALAKRLGEAGISPILCIVTGNTASENMFDSLGWKRTVPVKWVLMKPHLESANSATDMQIF